MKRTLTFIVATAMSIVFADTLAAQGRNVTAVREGDSASGDGEFSTFTDIFLNNRGEIAFNSTLQGTSAGTSNDSAIFVLSDTGTLSEVVRDADAALDGNGTFGGSQLLRFNDAGNYLIHSRFFGTAGVSVDDTGLMLGSSGTLTQYAREGNTTFDNNGTFGNFATSARNYGLSNEGFSSFYNLSLGTAGGTSDDNAIFARSSNYVREGDAAPGGIGNFTSFGNFTRINDERQVSFVGNVGQTTGIYRAENSSSVTPIFVEGDAAPDGNGTLSFLTGYNTINNSGQVAFEAVMAGTANGSLDSEGIFRGDGNSVRQIAREGQLAPGGNGEFNTFFSSNVRINESGQVALTAGLRNTSGGNADDSGVYRSSSSGFGLTEIARQGQDISTGDGQLGSVDFAQLAMNEQGHVAFSSSISGTINNTGIFIGNGTELITVVQEGQELDGGVVSTISFEGGDRNGNALNDRGQIAYRATLSNGNSSIQIWTPDLHWRRSYSSNWEFGSNWTLGISPDDIFDVYIDPNSSLTVNGPGTNTTVQTLNIGGGNGIATLNLNQGSMLTSTGGTTVHSTGILTGDGTIVGDVDNQGLIHAQNVLVDGVVTNSGVVNGTGRLHANIINTAGGEIRANDGNRLQLTGSSLVNAGRIEVLDGEIEVASLVQNSAITGLIAGRDAAMRFNGGLLNEGSLGISTGTSDLFGDIDNNGGTINISGGAIATFYDDVIQNGDLQVVSVGSSNSAAIFFGELSGQGGFTGGGDVFAFGDLRPGNSPASVLMDGNLYLGASTFSVFEFAGENLDEYDQLVVTGDLNLAGDLEILQIDGFEFSHGQQFLIADVEGQLTGQFSGFDEGALVGSHNGVDLFITYSAGDGNDVGLFSSVPEPGMGLFGLIAGLGLLSRRRRA